jgi:DNA polymerase-3 subunit alpha
MTPDELVARAKELGATSVTLTDHGTLLGIEPFMDAGKKYGINTIPGVEAYLEKRNHLILVAKNYKGFQAISHAMREANTRIERVGNKLQFPIMEDAVLEQFFKGNQNVIATSACVQGPIGYILLTNYRLHRQVAKEEKIVEIHQESAQQYEYADQQAKKLASEIKELKKEKTVHSKPLKPAHQNKITRLQNKLPTLLPGTPKYEDCERDLATAIYERDLATQMVEMDEKTLAQMQTELAQFKKTAESTKTSYTKYTTAKQKLDAVQYVDESVLYEQAKERLLYLKSIFPQFYIELQYHGLENEAYVMPLLLQLADETDTPIIAANDAHMKDSSESSIEARRIIRFNYFNRSQTTDEADKELYLKSDDELMVSLSLVVPTLRAQEAIANTAILDTCHVELSEEKHYPKVSSGETFDDLLKDARERMIAEGKWTDEYEARLNREVKVIKNMGYEDYHMVVRDFCNMGRILGVVPKDRIQEIPEDFSQVQAWVEKNGFKEGIGIGPGRGSAAGSLVCYMLGITNIDPIKYDLLFERFLNPERVSMPDIDTDVATSLRPVVIKYLKWFYGERAVCSIATETTYGAKGAVQMAGRERADQIYHGASDEKTKKQRYLYDKTLKLSDKIPATPGVTLKDCEQELMPLIESDPEMQIIWQHAKLLEGRICGTGIHAGGVVISDNDNINDYVPLAWNEEKQVWAAQCNMVKIEERGMLKFDLLGLNNLDSISDCLHLIKKYRGESIDINAIPFESEVFASIYATGNTNSVFQFESAGMKAMLQRFKPTCFEDIILLVAAFRPGPLQYLDNIIEVKNGRAPLTYKTPELEPILKNTYGATIYQEQVMKIFQELAGYSLGGADLVRRFMSKKKMDKLVHEREAFIYGDDSRGIDGCVKRGIDEQIANEIFDEMIDFAKYAFNRSHAAAYAYVSYQTAWLKYHYPAEYLCAMFNNKDQDSYSPIIADCNLYKIKLLPPDVNASYFDFVLESDKSIRYGLGGIKGIGQANKPFIDELCARRSELLYNTIQDFLKRNLVIGEEKTAIPGKKILETFTNVGAFDSLGYNRQALLDALDSELSVKGGPDFAVANISERIDEIKVEYLPADKPYNFAQELALLGTIVSVNPMDDYASDAKYDCTPIDMIESGDEASIMGFVVSVLATSSKKGTPQLELTLQGKTGVCTVCLTNNLYFRYSDKMESLHFRVIKVAGKMLGSKFYAHSLDWLSARQQKFALDLREENETWALMEMLSRPHGERPCAIYVQCWWRAGPNHTIYRSDSPKAKVVNMTVDEIRELTSKGLKFVKM